MTEEDAKEAAKRLVKSGAVTVKAQTEKSSFKRSKLLDKKLKVDSLNPWRPQRQRLTFVGGVGGRKRGAQVPGLQCGQRPALLRRPNSPLGFAAQRWGIDRSWALGRRAQPRTPAERSSTRPSCRAGGRGQAAVPPQVPTLNYNGKGGLGALGGGEGEDGWGGGGGGSVESGKVILVRGFDFMEDPLRVAFQPFGALVSLNIDERRRFPLRDSKELLFDKVCPLRSAHIEFADASQAQRAVQEVKA